MRLSIRWKIILSISIPLLVTYIIMLTWDYARLRSGAVSELQTLVLDSAESSANAINQSVERIADSAQAAADTLTRSPRIGEAQARVVLSQRGLRPNLYSTSLIYTSGGATRIILPNRSFEFRNRVADEPLANHPFEAGLYERLRRTKKAQWSEVHMETDRRQNSCAYIAPVLSNEEIQGAIIVDVGVSELLTRGRPGGPRSTSRPTSRPDLFSAGPPTTAPIGGAALVDSGPPPGEGGGFGGPPPNDIGPPPPVSSYEPLAKSALAVDPNTIALWDHDGRPLAVPGGAPRSALLWADENKLPDFTEAFHAAQNGASGIARVPSLADISTTFKAGEAYWIALTPITSTGWIYTSALPESQVIGPLMQRLQQRALFLVAGLVAILLVATFVSIRISRPIELMAGAVRQLAEGNLDARVTGVKSHDELGQLARAFNVMIGQLKAHVRALTQQTAAQEKVESELRIARQIQNDLLPRTFPPFPHRPEFDLYAVNVPAQGVAGDFYDFFFTNDDWLTLCIADVSGKGVPAALLMAVTRTIVRNLALTGMTPAEIVNRANEMLLADTSNNMFVTMFLAQYNTRDGRLRYVNAGHPRPYRFAAATKTIKQFGSITAPLLGVCDTCEIGPFEQAEDQLEPGQTLLLYTDGVTEARAADRSMLRDAGFEKLIGAHETEDVGTFCGSMVQAIEKFQNHQPADDITIVALKRVS